MSSKKISSFEKNVLGDRIIFFLPVFLSLLGLIMIFNASSISALKDFNDKFYYIKKQLIWFIASIFSLIFFSNFDYKKLKKISVPFLFICLFLLIIVLIPGIGKMVYGGRRWIDLGFFGFQPAELAKISLVIFFANFFEKRKEVVPFLIVCGFSLFLVMLEPDMGTATIIAGTLLSVFFISGGGIKNLIYILTSGGLVGLGLIIFSGYRRQRLMTFINSSFDAQKASYHLKQIFIALGSGGIFGRGFGQSKQKFLFIPEVTTDSIFAVIGEEFGFIGSTILIMVMFFLIYRLLSVAIKTQDGFGSILAGGLAVSIALQIIVNLGAMVSVFPLTGVPLPFISYGGSSLLISMSSIGIIYNISKNDNLI